MNLYCDLATFKARLGIAGTSDDAALLVLLENVSRAIDAYTGRAFSVRTETRYFDGASSPLLLDRDLIAVTTFKSDDNNDGSWETSWPAADYEMLPYNGAHKTAVAVTAWGARADFLPAQRKALEIAARWGYEETYDASGAAVNEGGTFSASDTTLTVSNAALFKTGQTIKIDSEQLYVSAISGNNLTVSRAVNGTTAATHADAAAISTYRYPHSIVEACIIAASQNWSRRAAGFVISTGDGHAAPLAELDATARGLLLPYRRLHVSAV